MRPSRQPRVLLAISLAIASALGAYACDGGTSDNPLNVHHPAPPGASLEDSSTAADATPGDAATDGGDATPTIEGGDGGNGADSGDAGPQVDGADASDAGASLDAADASG